MTYITSPAI